MSENNCAVYVHVNLINGKKYFGITTQEPEKRWQNGYGYYNNAHFKNAILKYGWENFAHYVLYRNIPIKIAKNIEETLIREHMSYDSRFGYNHTYGGELELRSEESRKKMSENNPMKRPEVVAKVTGKNHRMYGKHYSEAVRKKMSDAHNHIKKPVEAIDPKTGLREHYFESSKSAGRFGFHQGHVSECCNGRLKTHHGYVWRFVEEVNNDDIDSGQ